jgi:hypothetical protein
MIANMIAQLGLLFGVGKSYISQMIHDMNTRVGLSIKRPLLTDKQIEKRERFAELVRQDDRYNLP